jgi:hypothetical protein
VKFLCSMISFVKHEQTSTCKRFPVFSLRVRISHFESATDLIVFVWFNAKAMINTPTVLAEYGPRAAISKNDHVVLIAHTELGRSYQLPAIAQGVWKF